MAKISRRSFHVDAKDLKKSILNANKDLERKNDRLSNNIKDKEKSLKSLDKEINSSVETTKKIVALSKEINNSINLIVKKIKDGGKILLCGNGVKFVVVAYRATSGQSHPHLHCRRSAFHGIAINPFSIDAASFPSGHITAVESRSNFLIDGSPGQQVSSQLPAGKLIKPDVPVECPHHPVTVGPN